MHKLIFRLVFPLTFVSYLIFDKWWYVQMLDGPDEVVHGFPLINSCPSLATSMQTNYYVFETITNVAAYFLFWFALVFFINRFIVPISISNLLGKIFLVLFSVYLAAIIYFSTQPDLLRFQFKRDIDLTIYDKGFEWIWQVTPRPDYYKYHPELLKQTTTP